VQATGREVSVSSIESIGRSSSWKCNSKYE